MTRNRKPVRGTLRRRGGADSLTLPLALVLLLGCLTGSVFGGSGGPGAVLTETAGAGAGFWTSLLIGSKFHLAAFLLGSTYYGVALLPLLGFCKGWALSTAAEELVAARQSGGLAAALLSMGLPAVVSIACFLVLSADSFRSASRLLSLARGRSAQAVPYRLAHAALCAPLLLGGNALSFYLSEKLLSLLH